MFDIHELDDQLNSESYGQIVEKLIAVRSLVVSEQTWKPGGIRTFAKDIPRL